MIKNIKDHVYMEIALKLAKKAFLNNEVPVGAIIVNNGIIVAKGYNMIEKLTNPIMHAEIIAINKACKKLKTKFLEQCSIYITLEPCNLCMQAISMVRLKKIFFAAENQKTNKQNFLHGTEIYHGILETESKDLLKNFFQTLRIY
jgi:tRNA(adenine34) deaminase